MNVLQRSWRYEAADPAERKQMLQSMSQQDQAMRMLIQVFGDMGLDDPLTQPFEVTVDSDMSNGDAQRYPSIPDQVGKYHILKLLGAGGMGSVYLATDTFNNDSPPVALKTIRREFLKDALSIERFIGEIRAMAAVEHVGILPILDTGAERGIPFFTMPFVDGEDFSKRIKLDQNAIPGLDELRRRCR